MYIYNLIYFEIMEDFLPQQGQAMKIRPFLDGEKIFTKHAH